MVAGGAVSQAKVINVIHRIRYQGGDRASRSDIKCLKHASMNPQAIMTIA